MSDQTSNEARFYRFHHGKIIGPASEGDLQKCQPTDHINSEHSHRVGALIIHGYTSTPFSMQPLAKRLQPKLYRTKNMLIAGHFTTPEVFGQYTWQSWYDSVVDAYQQLQQDCDKVIIIGQSLGGILALLLAANIAPQSQLILLAPAVYLPRALYLSPYLVPLFKALRIHYLPAIAGDHSRKDWYEITFKKIPITAHRELHRIAKATKRKLPEIHNPTLIFGSTHDHAISTKNIKKTYDKLASRDKELIWLENSYHLISFDNDFEKVACKIEKKVDEVITS